MSKGEAAVERGQDDNGEEFHKEMDYQNLASFRLPSGFRGRSAISVQFWWLIQATLFRASPQFGYAFRRWLLRAFGAKIGARVLIRPTVTVTYPWKLEIEDGAWIGDDVTLYSLGPIFVGKNAVISQKSYICAADHDHQLVDFPIRARKINIGEQAWLGTDVFVGPGVSIGRAAVIGARSSVFRDMPAQTICLGSPCRAVKPRTLRDGSANKV